MHAWLSEKRSPLSEATSTKPLKAYRRLENVLREHEGTIQVLHVLKPLGVAMAIADVHAPYKD